MSATITYLAPGAQERYDVVPHRSMPDAFEVVARKRTESGEWVETHTPMMGRPIFDVRLAHSFANDLVETFAHRWPLPPFSPRPA